MKTKTIGAEGLRRGDLFSLGPRVASLPEAQISIAYGAWGRPFDNETLITMMGVEGGRSLIEATLITQRHYIYPFPVRAEGDPLFPPEEVERELTIGAALIRLALAANGWQDADLLIATSSLPPCDDFPQRLAERAGLASRPTKRYYLACNGAVAALLDILQDDSLREARVVIASVEGLSVSSDGTDVAALAIFGNGAAAIAFRPRQITLLAGQTAIVPDTMGVIRVPRTYDLPPPAERRAPPPWYTLAPGAEEMFAFGDDGVVTTLPVSRKVYHSEMEGLTTARFFARVVPPVVQELLESYRRVQAKVPERLFGLFHQPSGGVLALVNRGLEKISAKLGLPRMDVPWVMDQVGMGNVSSATTPIALAHLMQAGRLPRGEAFNITGFGVGASITSMMVQI
ncbi:MAG: 3-oxoacyl-[acyl-carrier-protein] synthase III C-terminal domain-containing protein [Anaerolineae bacterium]